MKRVLIISYTNSIRSQMVRGYLQYYARRRASIYNAGLTAGKLNPFAIKVMNEIGIDISNQTTNTLQDYETMEFDYIATVCDIAKDQCPYISSIALRIHQNFDDISKLNGSDEDKLKEFRRIREEARIFAHKFSKVHFKGLK